MTNRERYEAGMVMERNGASGADIAAALGYKNVHAWYNMKHHYKVKPPEAPEEKEQRRKALNTRAAAAKPDKPEPAPILEGINVEKVPVPVKPAPIMYEGIRISAPQKIIEPNNEVPDDMASMPKPDTSYTAVMDARSFAPAKRLSIKTELSAQGQRFSYRLIAGNVHIRRNVRNAVALVLSADELNVMLAELGELLAEVGG